MESKKTLQFYSNGNRIDLSIKINIFCIVNKFLKHFYFKEKNKKLYLELSIYWLRSYKNTILLLSKNIYI